MTDILSKIFEINLTEKYMIHKSELTSVKDNFLFNCHNKVCSSHHFSQRLSNKSQSYMNYEQVWGTQEISAKWKQDVARILWRVRKAMWMELNNENLDSGSKWFCRACAKWNSCMSRSNKSIWKLKMNMIDAWNENFYAECWKLFSSILVFIIWFYIQCFFLISNSKYFLHDQIFNLSKKLMIYFSSITSNISPNAIVCQLYLN